MKNNRAGLLALIVLGVATLLMVFFVLPRISDNAKPIGDAINDAGTAVKDAVELGGDSAGNILTDAAEETAKVAEKVGRLAAATNDSIKELTGLFADKKIPGNDAFAAARTKVTSSLKELSDVEIPDTLDDTTSRLITTARAAADRASNFLNRLPTDAAAAAAQVNRLANVFAGTDDGSETAAALPATGGSAALPVFDVLRVEPDGSAVIAGKAAAGSKLEILSNGIVISQTDIGPSGDFAAVLDTPLAPGDHQLVLRATGRDGKVSQSEEIATVSVPTSKNGELLAMVTKPGEASRLLTLPAVEQPNVVAASGANAPSASTDPAAQAPSAPLGGQTSPAPASGTPAAGQAEIQVTAVEFEGDKVFVAGSAPAGSKIIAYVDDQEIGSTTTEASGHFVVEGKIDLAVGNHIIRADMIDATGKVAVRVNVPFTRPNSDQAAVTIQQAPATPGTAPPSATTVVENPDVAVLNGLRAQTGKAFGILSGLYADGKTPQMDEMAAARSATSIALKSLKEFRLTAKAEAALTEIVADTAAKASGLLATVDALPHDVKSVGTAITGLSSRIGELTTPVAIAPAAGGPKVYEQAPLAHNENAVIIRRGDTLWQISRRIYGQGVRYTTIYLANQDQIQNPDLIEPGQIFGLPDKALPNAEELHRKRLSGG